MDGIPQGARKAVRLSPWMEYILKIVRNDFSAFFVSMDGWYSAMSQEGGAVISMDGVYAENRQERFQCTIRYSLFFASCKNGIHYFHVANCFF